MTRFMITLSAVALSISFAPAAHAYEVEPMVYVPESAVEMVVPSSQLATIEGACSLPIATVLTHILALPEDMQAETLARPESDVACAQN